MGETETAIGLRGVLFGYRPDSIVLDIASFDVARGERVFLEGASGSGKSTLLGLVGGILVRSQGEVSVLGR